MHRKIKGGLILLIIAGIFTILGLVLGIDPQATDYIYILFIFLSIPLYMIGLAFFIMGLNPRNRGIAFIGIGLFIGIFSSYLVFNWYFYYYQWHDVAIILSSLLFLFWALIFILPGIILAIKENIPRIYMILDILVWSTLMWSGILMLIFSNFSTLTFQEFFLLYFWNGLGLGFLIALITTGIGWLYQVIMYD